MNENKHAETCQRRKIDIPDQKGNGQRDRIELSLITAGLKVLCLESRTAAPTTQSATRLSVIGADLLTR